MVAVLSTGISYWRMAAAYPSASSAFTYVGREINPVLGLDYLMNPLICTISNCPGLRGCRRVNPGRGVAKGSRTNGAVLGLVVAIWATVLWKALEYTRGNNGWMTIGRLKPYLTWSQARGAFVADVAHLQPHLARRTDLLPTWPGA